MKQLLPVLAAACLCAAPALAQTTMPAIGASTPKGQVAKTDASINQRGESRRDSAMRRQRMPGKNGRKTKMKTSSNAM